jgi:hypothetical protein
VDDSEKPRCLRLVSTRAIQGIGQQLPFLIVEGHGGFGLQNVAETLVTGWRL